LLLPLDKVLEFGDVLNVMQADESNRIMERNEGPLFDKDAFREAAINAFAHNSWIDGNAPMLTIYSNRIEILPRGTLAPKQTLKGFFLGESVPVNQKLSDVILQLQFSERSGRGAPKIISAYGKEAFEFRENSIVVTIPFSYFSPKAGSEEDANSVKLNPSRQRILEEMRNNPNITQGHLVDLVGVGKTSIANHLSFLRENGFIERAWLKETGLVESFVRRSSLSSWQSQANAWLCFCLGIDAANSYAT